MPEQGFSYYIAYNYTVKHSESFYPEPEDITGFSHCTITRRKLIRDVDDIRGIQAYISKEMLSQDWLGLGEDLLKDAKVNITIINWIKFPRITEE